MRGHTAPPRPSVLLATALALGAGGCIDTDATVFVEPTIESASIDLEQSSLAAAVSGTATVRLRLGSRAADASTVTLRGFSLTDAARSGAVVDRLAVTASPPFPVVVGVDSDQLVTITFTATDNTFEASAADALCAPEGVILVGAFEGSLRGGGVDAASPPITVGMCP